MVYRSRDGQLGFDTARLMGLMLTRSISRARKMEYDPHSGVYEEDLRCDADSPQKLEYTNRLYRQ